MLQSKLFTKTIKELPKDETSFNARQLIRAGFIDKLAAGVYSFLPLGLLVHDKICRIIREEMDAIGGQEILMPALIPKESWAATNRWENFDALFRLIGGDKKEYGLGATHEEVVTPLVKKFIFSYKDLPAAVYQIQTKFRNELRAKAGLIRGREFSMKDLYSFHADEKDLNKFYEIVIKSYFKIFSRCGLGDLTYLTYALGGTFSKYSHEFQTLAKTGEDTIYLCKKCKIAVNKEIIEEQKVCPQCKKKDFVEEKAVEVGNIFKLGTRFSKPFGFSYMDEKGGKQDVIMGCYGLGPSRLMGTVVEVCHDEQGMIWPEEIAPFRVHLIEVRSKEAKVKKETEKLYNDLRKNGVEVLYDDRDEISAGEKFAEADLIGCPYRLVVSEKTLAKDSVEVKKRDKKEVEMVKISEVAKRITNNA
ncbi:MAG: His/Gly/Thr/Pro-type tRNA ligase C-terminal domain-containing protein [Patescibacteria group bacterium]|nr:His/Gly/Thr/Pro-type tRNA ligase C-terminal domain-containing protein [Patescibacteria group bacterium]MDD5294907.1 His/Gly/Thr/Pro-type tRNA ligase C-terminal domain-containing protein [Patescibacteria group bacterium]MDD5554601.1 His/Gly/Thr/Pro-type tRNA ligase C-terminal domain-containing protein [Patescibacteria group bacterium]